ncbi:GtrA family protein [Legionella sp. 227]|uniref:GtrA family protein n=1 Tax=Legionella sp. 227 TaxID=3367288 RepID=UPI00370D9BB2
MYRTIFPFQLSRNLIQFIRFGTVGLITNIIGYSFFLGLTWVGINPKVVITILFFFNLTFSFFSNRRWVFANHQNQKFNRVTIVRFIIAYLTGYLINLALLIECVDRLGYSPQLVQLIAIALIAIYFFFVLKLLVFRQNNLPALIE